MRCRCVANASGTYSGLAGCSSTALSIGASLTFTIGATDTTFSYTQSEATNTGVATTSDGLNFSGEFTVNEGWGYFPPPTTMTWTVSGSTVTGQVGPAPYECADTATGAPVSFSLAAN